MAGTIDWGVTGSEHLVDKGVELVSARGTLTEKVLEEKIFISKMLKKKDENLKILFDPAWLSSLSLSRHCSAAARTPQ